MATLYLQIVIDCVFLNYADIINFSFYLYCLFNYHFYFVSLYSVMLLCLLCLNLVVKHFGVPYCKFDMTNGIYHGKFM